MYRGKRIVNWCPSCTTAIADDEAEYVDEPGHLWHLRYPLVEPVDGMDYLVVATTRPETMLGDTGVAVSPQDDRYKNLVGKKVKLPIVDREIPVFSDFYVDKEFGTGCVKVTPAHDPNDFAMGERNGLEKINIFDETAHVVEGFGKFSGMSRDEAREAIVAEFEALGLLDHVEEHDHSVMHCYRCHNTLEPWLSEQWFVAVDELKKKAFQVVEDGSITFYPERWKQVYLDWLENLKDWCISRQLWWGHRIPMYYCDACGWRGCFGRRGGCMPAVRWARSPGRGRARYLVLFAAVAFRHAELGRGRAWARTIWLSITRRRFFPRRETSWAFGSPAMVMASEYCCDEIPFRDVIIHPTVMGADGKPMRANRAVTASIPWKLMEDYGADGMRFGLLMQVTARRP